LRRDEAIERAAVVRDISYAIVLDLTTAGSAPNFNAQTTLRFAATPGSATFVELQPAKLRSAVLNGKKIDIKVSFDASSGRLQLEDLAETNELIVDAAMAYSHDGEGLHRHTDPADGNVYLYATSALTCAPRWFACFDQPDLKARISLRVSADPTWTVLGNGPGTQEKPGQWSFAQTPPMPTYVATVCAGPWQSVYAEHDNIPLGIHARASLGPALDRDGAELLQFTANCFDEFHRLFGIRYPWGAYHQVFCPDFNWGAMENVGCVTLRDQMMFRGKATTAERAGRASVIAHEMAHMWFGNLTTFQWWDDMWLNEAFAEYLGYRVTELASDEYAPWIDFGIVRKSWGYTADRRPSTHPVAGNGIEDTAAAENAFDGISYAKGASVVRQVATYLGESTFLDGLRAYFEAHLYGNAEFSDLISAWTEAGAIDLDAWAAQWLQTSGVDTLTVEVGDQPMLVRLPPAGATAARPHAVTVAAFDATGNEVAHLAVHVNHEQTPLPSLPTKAALILPDALDQTWAKLALQPTEWRALPGFAARLPAPARVSVANAMRLAVADAELDPSIAVAIVTALLGSETDESVINSLTRWSSEVLCGTYMPAGVARDASLSILARAATVLLEASEPGSGRQLAAARAFVAMTPDDRLLHAWFGGEVPGGVELDADLRWAILARLVSRGLADEGQIENEKERDRSATGETNAIRLRALRPTAEAKAEAWQLLMNDKDASNYHLYAAAEGFWHPAHTVLTAPYVERFFDEIAGTVEFRSAWLVSTLGLSAFPKTAVEHRTVELLSELLANELPETLRRSLVDAGDDLQRALRSREHFS
jgi:aminopeptidase N